MKISKNNYSPNDPFLIKIFMKIISLDSSQRVPPMSPCPPLIVTTVFPWLTNPLSDPWDFNKSNGILLRSNWCKPYPKFYGSEFYGSGCVYLGVGKKTSQKVPTYLPVFFSPVLALYTSFKKTRCMSMRWFPSPLGRCSLKASGSVGRPGGGPWAPPPPMAMSPPSPEDFREDWLGAGPLGMPLVFFSRVHSHGKFR